MIAEYQVVRNKTDFLSYLAHRGGNTAYYQDGDIPYYLLSILPGVRTVGQSGPFTNAHNVKLNAALRTLQRNTWLQLDVSTVFNPWARSQQHTLAEGTEVWVRISAGWGDIGREDQERVNGAELHTLTRLPATVAAIGDTFIPQLQTSQPAPIEIRNTEEHALDVSQQGPRGTTRARAACAASTRRTRQRRVPLVIDELEAAERRAEHGAPEPCHERPPYSALHLLTAIAP